MLWTSFRVRSLGTGGQHSSVFLWRSGATERSGAGVAIGMHTGGEAALPSAGVPATSPGYRLLAPCTTGLQAARALPAQCLPQPACPGRLASPRGPAADGRGAPARLPLPAVLPLDEIALAIAGLNGAGYTSNPTLAYYLSLLRLVALVRHTGSWRCLLFAAAQHTC